MTKTNRSTLIATLLLGVLLYAVLRFAHDLNLAWDGSVLGPPPVTDDAQTQPRIASTMDLRAFLLTNDVDAATTLDRYAHWSDARGFTAANRLFGAADIAPADDLAAVDETILIAHSAAGDAAASQTLAAGLRFVDPLKSVELYRRAAEQGSTFALLRIGSLLEALDTVAGMTDTPDSSQRRPVVALTERGVGKSLRLTAFGYVLTAIRDGGPPIVDHALLGWLDHLHDTTTNEERVAVCRWSERTLVDIAKSRALWGKPAVTTKAPPVFFTVPGLADRLPCRQTAFPVENLLDFTDCTVTAVRNATDAALDLYICPSG